MVELHLLIRGRVQGVAFRVFVQRAAQELNLTGYVKNLPNGDVEVRAAGERGALKKLQQKCYHGPEQAVVAAIVSTWQTEQGQTDSFTIL